MMQSLPSNSQSSGHSVFALIAELLTLASRSLELHPTSLPAVKDASRCFTIMLDIGIDLTTV